MTSALRRGVGCAMALARTTGVLVALALAVVGACDRREVTSAAKGNTMTEVDELDELLGARVLAGQPGVQAHIHRPSPQLPLYEAYARFDGDDAAFRALASALGLGAAGTPTAGGHLPAAWRAMSGAALPWWDATADTPASAGARQFGKAGWIVAKLERGRVYLIVTDTGVAQR